MDSSDTDTEINSLLKNRLGLCEVCNHINAKYCCPKCEVKTCGLKCLQVHKIELNCTGIRDKTKFIPMHSMTETDFMSDYCFLEQCTRYVSERKRDKIKNCTWNKRLPHMLFKFREAAKERGTKLKFLLPNFTRSISNSSSFNPQEGIIYWRIEWIFPNAQQLKIVDEKCSENELLIDLVEKYFNPLQSTSDCLSKNLAYYQSRGIAGVTFLLKAEGIKKCKNRYFELDIQNSLKENFQGKTLVEYPAIYIVFSDVVNELFDVIDDEEEIERETSSYIKELDLLYGKRNAQSDETSLTKIDNPDEVIKSEEEMRATMERLEIKKKRENRRLKKMEIDKLPQNLLFADERLWDELSNSESGNETEEELGPVSKKIKLANGI